MNEGVKGTVPKSVKFVSAIKDAIFNKKMGVNFFPEKDYTQGGGGVVIMLSC